MTVASYPLTRFNLSVCVVADRFEPFVGAVLARDFQRDVREPAVGLRPVPVLDARGDDRHAAGNESLRGYPPLFLVPAAAGGADKDLPAALIGVMYVLCVAASRFERDVEQGELALFNVG